MKITISEQIAENLLQMIKKEELADGSKLPSENELCKMYDASRTSVRSALQQLNGQGFVKTVKGKGSFVCPQTAEERFNGGISFPVSNKSDRIELFEFRKTIEIESAYIAALRADAKIIQALNVCTDNMQRTKTIDDVCRLDVEFHRLIAEATDNSYFMWIYDIFTDAYCQLFYQNISVLGSFGNEGHFKILTAIEMRSGELAKKYMTEHLEKTMELTASQGLYT